jgi:hypothetical protein
MSYDDKPIRAFLFSVVFLLVCAGALTLPGAAQTTASVNSQEAQKIGIDAYIYGYSLITTEITRLAFINTTVPNPRTLQAPMGQIVSLPQYPPADYKGVSAPNADTLYSVGFVDVSREPWIFSYPNMGHRYFLFPMYDEWMVSIGSPGARTLGYGAQTIAITGPSWHGALPSGVTQQIKSPTGIFFIVGRVYAEATPQDYGAVHVLQKQFKLYPLSAWGKTYTPPLGKTNGPYSVKEKVRDIIDAMSASEYFTFMAKAMAVNPPILPQDGAIVAEMASIGLTPGHTFDMSKLSPDVQKALANVAKMAFPKIAALQKTAGKVINGWVIPGAAGTYGTDYLARAYIAAYGWPANLPQDADYPNTKVDSTGNPLIGSHTYKVHFAKGATPPVNGFWSITMYDDEYFFYPNPLNKLTESMRDHPKFNADGSLDLYFSHTQPSGVAQANWLPAPSGNFILMLRMYWPKENPPSILPPSNPTWQPPPVQIVK